MYNNSNIIALLKLESILKMKIQKINLIFVLLYIRLMFLFNDYLLSK